MDWGLWNRLLIYPENILNQPKNCINVLLKMYFQGPYFCFFLKKIIFFCSGISPVGMFVEKLAILAEKQYFFQPQTLELLHSTIRNIMHYKNLNDCNFTKREESQPILHYNVVFIILFYWCFVGHESMASYSHVCVGSNQFEITWQPTKTSNSV